ncbi:MAG: hypothetical protein ACO1QR_01405, partial [Chthoniobacteraceae bacterium]
SPYFHPPARVPGSSQFARLFPTMFTILTPFIGAFGFSASGGVGLLLGVSLIIALFSFTGSD